MLCGICLKRQQKVIYGKLRQCLGEIFHEFAGRWACKIEEGNLMSDHVCMCIAPWWHQKAL